MDTIRLPDHLKMTYCREIRQSIEDLEDSGYVVHYHPGMHELQVTSNESEALVTLEAISATGVWIVALHEPRCLWDAAFYRDDATAALQMLTYVREAEEYFKRVEDVPLVSEAS